jgi:4-hydroxy-tetrahydrodipicolinate reductase
LERYEEAVAICEEKGTAFIYGSNFSLGVNLFFELNKKLAGLMKGMDMYQASMEEIHHTKKLDAPSGTAITLAEGLIEKGLKSKWSLDEDAKESLKIDVKRQGDVPGTHSIAYRSEVDEIYIRHEAFNRDGFGLGAVVAAEWLKGKTGVYSMKDVLNL